MLLCCMCIRELNEAYMLVWEKEWSFEFCEGKPLLFFLLVHFFLRSDEF